MIALLETLLYLVIFYIFLWISVYIWSVVKTFQYIGAWCFKIKDGFLGIFKLPRFLTFWFRRK